MASPQKVLCEKMFTDLNVVHCIHILQLYIYVCACARAYIYIFFPMNMYNFCLNKGYLNETEFAEIKSNLVSWKQENTRFSLML